LKKVEPKNWYTKIEISSCPICEEEVELKELCRTAPETININYQKLISDFHLTESISLFRCKVCDFRFYNPQLVGNSELYSALSKYDWYYLPEKWEFETAAKFLPPSAKILEFGGGSGEFRKYLDPGSTYLGTELQPSEELRKIGIITEEEIADSHFDAVVSFQFMEHIPNIKNSLLKQWDSILVGGVLIFAVPSNDSFLKFAHESALNHPPHHLSLWSDETIRYISDNLFKCSQLTIMHEPLAANHRKWANSELIFRYLRKIMFVRSNMLYSGRQSDFLWRVDLFFGNLIPGNLSKRGHTVLAIFRKL
jgi:SAM-dependent methyltransferase